LSDSIVLSPFRYEKAYRICDNEKGSISRPEIHDLISSNELTAAHIDIIKLVYQYKYLTSHQIEMLFGDSSLREEGGLAICSLKEAVSFMVKKGLILRHHFSWQEELNGEMTERRSVNFYTLSKGTCLYLEKDLNYEIDTDSYMVFAKDYTIYQKLAINSFVAKYKNNTSCRHNTFEVDVKAHSPLYNTDFIIDCTVKCNMDDAVRSFVVLPVRRNKGWAGELELKLKLLKDHLLSLLAKKLLQEAPCIILLCEDDMHMIDTHLELKKMKLNFQYFFTTDVRQHNNYTFDKLLVVSTDDQGAKYREYPSPLVQ